MQLVIGLVAGAVVFGALGFWIGSGRGERRGVEAGQARGLETGRKEGLAKARTESEARMRSLVEAMRRGRTPQGIGAGSAEAELQRALEEGWAPREQERSAALREAVGRVSAFLEKSVRAPLAAVGEDATAAELRERIGRALGALQDLDFFGKDVPAERQGTDLGSLVQRVSKEFVTDQGIGVRLGLSDVGVRASVNPAALMDALYLVLHNAARFGNRQTIDLGVAKDGSRARITVRDRGRGFSEEAFRRAFDPFYSTSEEGLGLGLPHARKVIEAMGGRIELRNVPDGGAEVEISFPTA
ncbi:MAG: sensor histidine kinase [Gemmatimonadales bacterium]